MFSLSCFRQPAPPDFICADYTGQMPQLQVRFDLKTKPASRR